MDALLDALEPVGSSLPNRNSDWGWLIEVYFRSTLRDDSPQPDAQLALNTLPILPSSVFVLPFARYLRKHKKNL
jgi:hypothetical protein